MIFEVENNELWPYYTLQEPSREVKSEYFQEVSPELHEEYTRVMSDFQKLQEKLAILFNNGREAETKRYYEKMEEPRSKKIQVIEYLPGEENQCSLCQENQTKGIYQGGIYIGCENCSEIKAPTKSIRPNLLEDSLRVSRFS